MYRQLTAAALLLLALPVCALAQLRPPRAEVTPLVERDGVEPGGAVRVALSALLPEGLHANSNRPRDPLLIAMEVMPEPPATHIVILLLSMAMIVRTLQKPANSERVGGQRPGQVRSAFICDENPITAHDLSVAAGRLQ